MLCCLPCSGSLLLNPMCSWAYQYFNANWPKHLQNAAVRFDLVSQIEKKQQHYILSSTRTWEHWLWIFPALQANQFRKHIQFRFNAVIWFEFQTLNFNVCCRRQCCCAADANCLGLFSVQWHHWNLHTLQHILSLIKCFTFVPAVFDCRFLWIPHQMIPFRYALVSWKSALDRLSVVRWNKKKTFISICDGGIEIHLHATGQLFLRVLFALLRNAVNFTTNFFSFLSIFPFFIFPCFFDLFVVFLRVSKIVEEFPISEIFDWKMRTTFHAKEMIPHSNKPIFMRLFDQKTSSKNNIICQKLSHQYFQGEQMKHKIEMKVPKESLTHFFQNCRNSF